MTKQFNVVPDRPATIVVHPTAGVGDATTIADGVAMLAQLSSAGGSLLLREGTYSLTTTVTLPVAKPITITGCGASTIISLGSSAICAFTIPDGYTTNTPINFYDFHVTGTEVANQGVVACNDSKSLSEVYLTRVDTVGVQQFVQVNDGSFDGTTDGQDDLKIHITQCRIRPITTDTSVIIRNFFGGFVNIRTWMTEVQFEGDNIFAVTSPRTDPLWGYMVDDNYFGDLYMDRCEMSLGGSTFSQDLGVIQAKDCWFTNNDSTTNVIYGSTSGSTAGYGGSTFTNCTLRALSFDHFDNVTYTGCTLDAWHCVTWEPAVFQGNNFMNSYGSPYPFNASGGANDPFIIENFGSGTVISNNIWANFDAVPTGMVNGIQASMIEIFAETTITGNDFTDVDPPTLVGIIEVFNSNCVFIGNRFPFAPTSGPPMKDWNGSNYFYGNSELFNSNSFPPLSGPIFGPAGDGLDPGNGSGNVIEGTRAWNGTGSTGHPGNVTIVDYKNPAGLAQTKGYVQNTHGTNSFTLTEEYITDTLGTFTRNTTMAPGDKVIIDPFDFTGLGAIYPQVVRYRVRVVTISGTASFLRYFAAPGGVFQF